jgi:hypothetical protein
MSDSPHRPRERPEPVSPEQKALLRRQLLARARALWDFIKVEAAVGSQLDAVKRQIAGLSKLYREKDREISDLEAKIAREEERRKTPQTSPAKPKPSAGGEEEEEEEAAQDGAADEQGPADMKPPGAKDLLEADLVKQRDTIVQLERELAEYYKDRAVLLKQSRQRTEERRRP